MRRQSKEKKKRRRVGVSKVKKRSTFIPLLSYYIWTLRLRFARVIVVTITDNIPLRLNEWHNLKRRNSETSKRMDRTACGSFVEVWLVKKLVCNKEKNCSRRLSTYVYKFYRWKTRGDGSKNLLQEPCVTKKESSVNLIYTDLSFVLHKKF